MAANTTPVFTIVPVIGMVRIATANTNRDGTGTLGDVVTGGTNGTRIDKIVIEAIGTTTAGMVRLYINDGTNTRLWQEVMVAALTPSGTVQAFRALILTPDPQSPLLVLPVSYVLRASTVAAESFDVSAHGGNF